MKKNIFRREVLRREPRLFSAGKYFYMKPDDLMFSGFLLDSAPFGFYPWQFYLPLFEKWKVFHLGFAHRILSMQDPVNRDDAKELAEKFVECICPHMPLCASLTDVDFWANFVKSSVNMQNLQLYRSYASSLLLSGRDSDAVSAYAEIVQASGPLIPTEFIDETQTLISYIKTDRQKALNILLQWIDESKSMLSI